MSLGSKGHFAPPSGAVVKNPPASAGGVRDMGLITGSGRSPGGGNGNPLQYFYLGNPMDRGTWWTAVHGVSQSWTQLSMRTHAHAHTLALSLSQEARGTPPPSRMPDLVITISSFQEKHTLGKRWGFFSPAVLCISQPWFCCFAISPLPRVGVSSFLDVP